jgi:cytochrome c oxidase cbb3-type subunit III
VRRAIPVLCCAGLWVGLLGCDPPGRPNPKNRPVPADQVDDFATLYGTHCSGCHGATGQIGPAPPLNDPLFRSIISEEELERAINEGRPGTPMPGFSRIKGGVLTAMQISVLVKEIKGTGTSPAWGVPRTTESKLPKYAESTSAAASGDRKRGADVFANACANCHGDDGMGLHHEGERHLRINDPVFLALISDQALRRFIITGRPDFGMPNFAEDNGRPLDFKPLTERDIDDLTALLSSWRQRSTR